MEEAVTEETGRPHTKDQADMSKQKFGLYIGSSEFWPAWLSEDGPLRSMSIRIATFDYDANLQSVLQSKRDLGLRDFAQQLLLCMEEYFERYGNVFPDLCHSDWDRLQPSSLLIA